MDRPHRHLHREGGEEGEPEPGLQADGEIVLQERHDVRRPRVPVHRDDRDQHQERAEQRVEEELEARIDAPLAAPDADDQEHRDEAGLEEDVEQHEVERHEHADHQRLEHEEGDHVLLQPVLDRLPGGDDAERHQEGGQQHERHREAVDAELEPGRLREPGMRLDELEIGNARIEARPGHEREQEGDDRRRQRRPT
jgi:hypothetical protein